jgi:hypothetical protein
MNDTTKPADLKISDLTLAQMDAINLWEAENNNEGQFEFQDNHRYARVDNPAEVAAYEARRWQGCCGTHDVELDTVDGRIMYGFNHGH